MRYKTLLLPPQTRLEAFCRKWMITELALFGSALREDFGPDSDIDLLVTFASGAKWTLLDHMRMELELAELFQREIDLIDYDSVTGGIPSKRKREILTTAQTIYSEVAEKLSF